MSFRQARSILRTTLIACSMLSLATNVALAQSDGSGKGSSKDGGNSGGSGGSQKGGQDGSTSQSNSSSTRVEADMLAYEASDTIASHIASNVCGHRLVIYDAQTFASLQAYDANSAALKLFTEVFKKQTFFAFDGGAAATALQTVVGTLSALKSSTEFQAQPTNIELDALTAQVANKVSGLCSGANASTVIVPKILLLNDFKMDAQPTETESKESESDCSSIAKTVPQQLKCIIDLRNTAMQGNKNSDYLDKLFQVFLGNVLGVSADSAVKPANKDQIPNENSDKKDNSPDTSPGQQKPTNTDQSSVPPLLASIVQGHRIQTALKLSNPSSRLLVLEATTAGGSYRIRHNFWVELFWTTPNPSFNGGAVVTYFLINPIDSSVEKSEVLRYMFQYGKFKDLKPVEKGANFCPVGETCGK